MSDLTFREFQALNARRCAEAFHDPTDWPLEMWALAIAGEAGELANLVKKVKRGDFTLDSQCTAILHEVADVMTYCDLLVTFLGADTDAMLMAKFDLVSARVRWKQ